jgi:Uma2 family endonuclease
MTLQERLVPGRYRLTIDDYERLEKAGAFGDQRTELLDGEITVMAPDYRLRRALEDIGSELHAASGSVLLSGYDMPQPDIALTSEPRGEGPIPLHSIRLLVEVSSTTLGRDKGKKLDRYATAGVPEYWIADLGAGVIHQMWAPEGSSYTEHREVAFGDPIAAIVVAGLVVDTAF